MGSDLKGPRVSCHAVTMGSYSVSGMYDCNGRWAAGRTYVYMFMARDNDGPMYVKVGYSENPVARLPHVQNGCPFRIVKASMVKCVSRDQARAIERRLHGALAEHHSSGEWFRFDWADVKVRQKLASTLEIELSAIRGWEFEEIDIPKAARMQRALAAERQRRSRMRRRADRAFGG